VNITPSPIPDSEIVAPGAFGIYDRVRITETLTFGDGWVLQEGTEGIVVQLYADPKVGRRGVFLLGVIWENDPESDRIAKHRPAEIEIVR
jgi:hypothetical protein